MKGKILKGRVLVKVIDNTETTDSGIILTEVETKQKVGKVVISSSEQVEVGEEVVFIADGTRVHLDEDYKLLKESDVLYIK